MAHVWNSMAVDAHQLTEELGEDVTYTPSGGVARTVKAVVVRGAPSPVPGATPQVAPSLQIFIRDSATAGVEDVKARDIVAVAARVGGTAKNRVVTRVVGHESGWWLLEVR